MPATLGANQGLQLVTEVENITVATTALNGIDPEAVQVLTQCTGGSASSCPVAAWDETALAENTVTITLSPTGDTDLDADRIVYVWAVRAFYLDMTSGLRFWESDYLNVDTATYTVHGSPGSQALATNNVAWRVTDDLDGVQVAHDIAADDWDDLAFNRLMEHTCHYLHSIVPGWPPLRCLVDERATVYDVNYVDELDISQAWSRLDAGNSWGDGAVATLLPMEIANIGADQGRFTPREPFDANADAMVYEARLTRTYIGETHEWVTEVPAGCDGEDWEVEWAIDADIDEPVLRWYADWYDGATGTREDREEGLVSTTTTGSTTFLNVAAGDTFVVGWIGLGEGDTPKNSNNDQFTVTPLGSCGTPLTWGYVASMDDTTYAAVEDMYDCITDWFDGATTGPCAR